MYTPAFRALYEPRPQGKEDHLAFLERTPKRIRVMLGGATIADSTRVQIMYETNHQPVYYFPMEDVRMDLMYTTDTSTT